MMPGRIAGREKSPMTATSHRVSRRPSATANIRRCVLGAGAAGHFVRQLGWPRAAGLGWGPRVPLSTRRAHPWASSRLAHSGPWGAREAPVRTSTESPPLHFLRWLRQATGSPGTGESVKSPCKQVRSKDGQGAASSARSARSPGAGMAGGPHRRPLWEVVLSTSQAGNRSH